MSVDTGVDTSRWPELSVALAEAFHDDPVMSWLLPDAGPRLCGGSSHSRPATWRCRLPHAVGLLSALERRHPRQPHYYLAYIGVSPAAQGLGVGTRLLESVVERSDRERLPAYLEASSPRNAELYRRTGFEGIAVVRPFGAPPMELMIREPRS